MSSKNESRKSLLLLVRRAIFAVALVLAMVSLDTIVILKVFYQGFTQFNSIELVFTLVLSFALIIESYFMIDHYWFLHKATLNRYRSISRNISYYRNG